MEDLSPKSLKEVRGDGVLVEVIKGKDMIGSIVVPESVKDQNSRGEAWRGRVVAWGPDVEVPNVALKKDDLQLVKGQVFAIDPVALDCPKIGPDHILVKGEDLLALES